MLDPVVNIFVKKLWILEDKRKKQASVLSKNTNLDRKIRYMKVIFMSDKGYPDKNANHGALENFPAPNLALYEWLL